MLNSFIITLTIESIEYQIFVSPFSLHSKEKPEIKSGKIEKLFFYNQLKDAEYEENIQNNLMDNKFNSENCIINYGQDFKKYYLGSFKLDFDSKRFWEWEGNLSNFREQEAEILANSLFNPSSNHKSIMMFTTTEPSDIKLNNGSID
jgi:hypothetical protein